MLLDLQIQEAISVLTIKDITISGILIGVLLFFYRHFTGLITKLEEQVKEKDEKIELIREKYDEDIKELRREQTDTIKEISKLISDNTRVLQEVSIELSLKRRRYEKDEM